MNYYTVDCSDEMGGYTWYFCHPEKTLEQFNQDCADLIKDAGRQTIDGEDYPVEPHNIVEALADLLAAHGYERIEFRGVSYEYTSLSASDSSLEWREILGDELYDEAVAKSFHTTIANKYDTIFIIMGDEGMMYHKRDCPILLAACGKEIMGIHGDPPESMNPCKECR